MKLAFAKWGKWEKAGNRERSERRLVLAIGVAVLSACHGTLAPGAASQTSDDSGTGGSHAAGSGTPDAGVPDMLGSTPGDAGVLDTNGHVTGDAGVLPPPGQPHGDAAAGESDAAPVGTVAADAGQPVAPPSGSVPVFVALGHVGRTLVSCDDGQTWVGDRDEDDANTISCTTENCDHDQWSAKEVVYSDGWFVTLLGWGVPSSIIKRSQDGTHWETVLSNTNNNFAAIVAGDTGNFMVLDNRIGRVSNDHGATWQTLSNVNADTEVVGYGDSKVFVFGKTLSVVSSADFGKKWTAATSIDPTCSFDFYNSGLAVGAGKVLAVGNDGLGCYSADSGVTFHPLDTTRGEVQNQVVWSGSEFMVWGPAGMAHSPDGATWTKAPVKVTPSSNGFVPVVAKSPSGSFVGAVGQYSTQYFARSTDGINWQRLSDTAFSKGHPIRSIVAGYLPAGKACQLP